MDSSSFSSWAQSNGEPDVDVDSADASDLEEGLQCSDIDIVASMFRLGFTGLSLSAGQSWTLESPAKNAYLQIFLI